MDTFISQSSEHIKSDSHHKVKQDSLSDLSSDGKWWDKKRLQADLIQAIFKDLAEFERLSHRMSECAEVLQFGEVIDTKTGKSSLRLRNARFCRVRSCPICQARRSMMWQARFFQAMPRIEEEFPSARWVFLTLTVKNCPVSELNATLKDMSKSWDRFVKHKEFKAVLGWVRTTEVTRSKTGEAHPHFHCLLMVQSNYFGKNYVKQSEWRDAWKKSARLDYDPQVNIKVVKSLDGDKDSLHKAVAETLKYSVKPSDMIEDKEWFLELTRQLVKKRFVSTGGVLKDVLKSRSGRDDDFEDLVEPEPKKTEEVETGKYIEFTWMSGKKKYIKSRTLYKHSPPKPPPDSG